MQMVVGNPARPGREVPDDWLPLQRLSSATDQAELAVWHECMPADVEPACTSALTRRSHPGSATQRGKCYNEIVRFRLLGPLEVDAAVDHPALRRHKPRALLALLLVRRNEVVSRDALLDGLWGESPPPRALGSLQNYVSQLRRALGDDVLLTQPSGYQLRVGPDELDVDSFERLVVEAAGKDATERAERLRSALALWRGPALADFTYEPFAQTAIARLEELRLVALEERIDADLALRRHTELVGELEALVAENSLRERLRGQLMLALYRSGRQSEALAVYRDGARLLREELGLEPSDELRRLERAILEQDPSLAADTRPAPAPTPTPTVRKIVTVLFADVAGHTRLTTTLDPEALRDVMTRFFGTMRVVIDRHGGTIEKYSGDEVMAVFGVPIAHEDDAVRAVRAAADMQAALRELNESLERDRGVRLGMRVGINTGEVVTGDASAGPLVTGEAVNVGKRLQEHAAPGEVILGPVTVSLARDSIEAEPVGALNLRGRTESLPAFRFMRLRLGDVAERPVSVDAPLVGRRNELRKLRNAYRRARDERRCVFAVVVGEAGIGKSRLARELVLAFRDEASVLVGRCVSYGEGATYLPIGDVVRQATRERSLAELLADEEDASVVADRVSALTEPGDASLPAGDSFWAVRRLLEALARRRPLVLVLEDAHWAEPTLLDLIEYVAGQAGDAPLLVVTVARPDLLERRPAWSSIQESTLVRLEPLDEDESRALIGHLAAEGDLDEDAVARVTAAAEGNPLFAEQIVALVREQGPEALDSLPPTVEALLASRVDALAPSERTVAERAAVIGRVFRRDAVVALSPPDEAGSIVGALSSLERKGFVRESRAEPGANRFHHVLVRDTVYRSIPKARRAELHEGHADWLARRGDAADELVGHHLEQAYRHLTELAPPTRHTGQLATDAGERLGRAGIRASQRGDIPATLNLLGRATSLLPDDSERYRELLTELSLARWIAGDTTHEDMLAESIAAWERVGDRRHQVRAELELAYFRAFGQGRSEDVIEIAERAIPIFEAVGDHRALGRAWLMTATIRVGFECRHAAAEAAFEHALEHYRRAGWPIGVCAAELAGALYFGPRSVNEGLARAAALLSEDIGLLGETNVEVWVAGLESLRGRFDEARQLVAQARGTYEELGLTLASATTCGHVGGMVELLAGDAEAAEHVFRESCETLERHERWAFLATRAAELAEALYAQGAFAEAERWADVARRHTSEGDISAQFPWRAVLAKVLAQQGAVDDAEALGREAVVFSERTDAINQRGYVLLSLAEVLKIAGRTEDASKCADSAAALFARKGNVMSAARANELRATLAVA
jgi:DNA-binding SARP family transcriptional activator/tetratricopeptide (TPR) repeat protein